MMLFGINHNRLSVCLYATGCICRLMFCPKKGQKTRFLAPLQGKTRNCTICRLTQGNAVDPLKAAA